MYKYDNNVRDLVALKDGFVVPGQPNREQLRYVEAPGNIRWEVPVEEPISSILADEQLIYIGGGDGQSVFGYTGEQTDPTGLVYLRTRYYDPVTGWFMSRDAVEGEPPYAYVGGECGQSGGPEWEARLTVAGAEKQAYESKDAEQINAAVKAINEAIAERGQDYNKLTPAASA